MSETEIIDQIRRLPEAKRHELAERIWMEFGEPDDDLILEEIAELDRRAERALKHPELCRPLDDVVADIEERFRAKR